MSAAPIYMDHHATTPVDERVMSAMRPYFSEHFGNASSRIHAYGRNARDAVEAARAQVAELLGASADDIVFTSGATESDNLAIQGVARALSSAGKHLVTAETEHKAVLDACGALEREGWEVTRLPVDQRGLVSPEQLRASLRDDTVLVSIMLSNNEVGVAQDVRSIGATTREHGICFHCDAAQGLGYLPFSVEEANVDLASVSAHKIYGPKGVGGLYVSRALRSRGLPAPLFHGGGHERGFRSGTLNVPGIVGLGEATALMSREGAGEAKRIEALRDELEQRLTGALEEVRVNGAGAPRHPGNLNVSFGYVDGAALLIQLCEDVAVSSGAACSSVEAGPSYVLEAMGVPKEWAAASIRFGLGRATSAADIDRAAESTIGIVRALRDASPLWLAKQEGVEIDW